MIEPSKIVRTAESFLGQGEEGGENVFQGQFDELLKAVGHNDGEAWCDMFVELVWKLAAIQDQELVGELTKTFTKSAVKTHSKLLEKGWEYSIDPSPGCIVTWQKYKNGKKQWQGHTGIVIEKTTNSFFTTIEGNTNYAGSREGDAVLEKVRSISAFYKTDGLRLLGFIKPYKTT